VSDTTITPAARTVIARALFAEQISHLSMHVQHGDSDARKGTAKLMRDALEKRRDEIMAEVLAGGVQ
jgi:hypothetical protein